MTSILQLRAYEVKNIYLVFLFFCHFNNINKIVTKKMKNKRVKDEMNKKKTFSWSY